MIPLTTGKKSLIVLQENAVYAKKDLVLMITIKNRIRLEIIVTIVRNIEVLLIIFAT